MDKNLDSEREWEEKYKSWEKQFNEIDKLLEQYKKNLNGDIEKYEYDEPTRSLHWNIIDGIECSISMYLEEKLKIWGMAWQDDEKKLERHLRKKPILKQISLPLNKEKLHSVFEEIIETLNKTRVMDLNLSNHINKKTIEKRKVSDLVNYKDKGWLEK
jgi:hypothetical protein